MCIRDSLGVAVGLVIKAGQRQFGQVGQIPVPGPRSGLQIRLRRGILPQLLIGDASKVLGFGAPRKPAILAGHGGKLLIRGLGAIAGRRVDEMCIRDS